MQAILEELDSLEKRVDAAFDTCHTDGGGPESDEEFTPPDLFQDGCDGDDTGVVHWPGGRVLAEWLHLRPELTRGKVVLELGAGKGLPGFTAARVAKHTILTDGNSWVVEQLRRKAAACGYRAHGCRLEWGQASDMEAVKELCPELVDLMVAGDVLYGNWLELLDLMLATAARLLSHRPGSALVVCGCLSRIYAASVPSALEDARALARSRGFSMAVEDTSGVEPHAMGLKFKEMNGHILTFARHQAAQPCPSPSPSRWRLRRDLRSLGALAAASCVLALALMPPRKEPRPRPA